MINPEPCYNFESQTECNSLIRDLPCSFVLNEENFECRAEIILDPDCSLDIRTEIPLDLYEYFSLISSMSSTKSIILNGLKISAFVSQVSSSSDEKAIITFTPNQEPIPLFGDDESKMSKVIFHLFDFKDRKGTSRKVIRSENSAYTLGVTELASPKWKVELHEIKSAEKSDSKKNRYPTLTHVCILHRRDGSEFDGKTARQMMLDLRLFFTFSQGFFCSPVMPVGFDNNERQVWAEGSSPDPNVKNSMSWFDPYNSEQLARLFPHFMVKLEDERWWDTFHSIIYWYSRSNNTSGSGIDTGIILTQIAIERLAYEFAFDNPKCNGFKDFCEIKNPSDRFRYLFTLLDIPLEFPTNFTKIKKISSQEGIRDGPYFLTAVRNSMVHPDNKRRGLFKDLYYDAWRLGMWYLELSILRICNYEGSYANRLRQERHIGEVEEVPWCMKQET